MYNKIRRGPKIDPCGTRGWIRGETVIMNRLNSVYSEIRVNPTDERPQDFKGVCTAEQLMGGVVLNRKLPSDQGIQQLWGHDYLVRPR